MLFKLKHNIRVAVGMSGGVDSSVAAAMLKRQGYEVIGIFMKYWSENEGQTTGNKCCSVDSFEDGRRVSETVGVPIYTYNFREPFKESIVDYFIDEYKGGRTPNPCVRCNQLIKFGLFWEKARELGCEYIATGHYARLKKDWRGRIHVYAGADKRKDQSYFLYRVPQEVLRHCLFPLGTMTKDGVRALAKEWGIGTFNKAESQEICFVANQKHYEFLKRHLAQESGRIVTVEGKEVGTHEGLAFYTIGQRNRLPLMGGPWFVIGMNHEKNELIVTSDLNHSSLCSDTMRIADPAWITREPKIPMKVLARIRYGHPGVSATITKKTNDGYEVRFAEKQRAITPGQSAVFYTGSEVIGGGIISA